MRSINAEELAAESSEMSEDPISEVLRVLQIEEPIAAHEPGPNDAVSLENKTPYPPEVADLARLWKLVRTRRVTTILEFGSGYSTAVMADALARNRGDFAANPDFQRLRRNNPFELHSVDCNLDWLNVTRSRLTEAGSPLAHLHHSTVTMGAFNDRMCHYYDMTPNICPDFIYLDGPMQHDARGEIGGIHFRHNDRTVIAADIARMEWLLLPGTLILVDGRTNNARFLKANFQRAWSYTHDAEGDVHLFELTESPLGNLNRRQIEFCLGKPDWARSGAGAPA